MANNKLQMPADYVALNESEMSCVEGGGVVSQVFYAFGKMFSSDKCITILSHFS